MAKTFSFDIVSEYDQNELDHAVDQARRELQNRYDFKGTPAKLDYTDEKKNSLTVEGESDYQLTALIDMIRSKLAKRGLSQKILDIESSKPNQAGMILRQVVPFVNGLDQAKAKDISKKIRDNFPKAKPQIQGEEIRVTSQSKDELQAIMTMLKEQNLPYPVNFTNYR